MYLQQYTCDHSGLGAEAVDEIEQFDAVYAFNQGGVSDDAFDLVGLQVAYEVPAHVIRHLRNFGQHFLYAAFAEYALPCIVGSAELLDGMKFADSHQCHAL